MITAPGFYAHHEGHLYEVIGIATHEGKPTPFVVFKQTETGKLHILEQDAFEATVPSNKGHMVPKFVRISEN